LQAAVGEALAFLDQSLDSGFRPGMGNVVPDRFFWAMPPADQGEEAAAAEAESLADDSATKGASRRVH
jgi:hydroxymethylpyrimidine/phosphomethylpyrimidine kinase